MPLTHTRRPYLRNDSGQTLTEYSLILVLIAVGIAVVLPGLTSALSGFFTSAAAAFGV